MNCFQVVTKKPGLTVALNLFGAFSFCWLRSEFKKDIVVWHRAAAGSQAFSYKTVALVSVDGGIAVSSTLSSSRKADAAIAVFQEDLSYKAQGFSHTTESRGNKPGHARRMAGYLISDTAHPFGFELLSRSSSGDPTFNYHAFCAPWWAITLLPFFMVLKFAMMASRIILRRNEKRCTTCGYDLRASANVCPECGTIFSSSRSS